MPRYFINERAKALKEREKLLGQILAKLGPQEKDAVSRHCALCPFVLCIKAILIISKCGIGSIGRIPEKASRMRNNVQIIHCANSFGIFGAEKLICSKS